MDICTVIKFFQLTVCLAMICQFCVNRNFCFIKFSVTVIVILNHYEVYLTASSILSILQGFSKEHIPRNLNMFKLNNRNIRTKYEICSNLTKKTPERRQWRHSAVFIVSFEHIPHLVLVFYCCLWAGKCRLGHRVVDTYIN